MDHRHQHTSSVKGLRNRGKEGQYVDTPMGLFTASGIWFRTSEQALQEYAAPVLEHEPVERLLARSERWLRSAQTVALWLLPVLLMIVPPLSAALSTLTIYIGWRALSPAFTSRWVDGVLRVLDLVFVQGLYYVLLLSMFAAQEAYALVWIGLAGFILLRWNVISWASRPVVQRIWASLFKLPVADQVLRGFIIRAALANGVSLPELDRMERQILEHTRRSSK
jgi:hypothetical protein